MIQLCKTIKVGPTTIPAGTFLDDKFEPGIAYYQGTKVELAKIPQFAIYVPSINDAREPFDPEPVNVQVGDQVAHVRNVYREQIEEGCCDCCASEAKLAAVEAKHVGQTVTVVDYDYDAPGHAKNIAEGRLQAIGTFAKMSEHIKKDSERAYEELAKHCKTGREVVFKVNGGWFCHEGGKIGLEDVGLQIVPAEEPNTDHIMLNGAVVANIVSPKLTKASYPDTGYYNSEETQITVLNTKDEKLELKCIEQFADRDENAEPLEEESQIVMFQDILDELAPILAGNEDALTDNFEGIDVKGAENLPKWSVLDTALARAIYDQLLDIYPSVSAEFTQTNVTFDCWDQNMQRLRFEVIPELQMFNVLDSALGDDKVFCRKIMDLLAPSYQSYAIVQD